MKKPDRRGRPAKPTKQVVFARVEKDLVDKLDEMAREGMPQLARSQLVELAISQYVEREYKGKR